MELVEAAKEGRTDACEELLIAGGDPNFKCQVDICIIL